MARVYNELRNYQNVPRELVFDKNLSDRARFVYVFMACKPDDWDFYLEPMAKDIGYSVDTLRKYINELVTSGWLIKGEQTNENGVFGAVEYTLKATKKTDTEFFRHGENPILTNSNNDCNSSIEDKKQEDIKELKEKFASFVKKYKKAGGRVRGVDTEFNDFSKRHKDWKEIIPYLDIALEKEIKERESARIGRKFYPEMKNLQTYLGKQRAWEMYVTVGEDFSNEYIPSGHNVYYDELRGFYYYTGFYMRSNDIMDGYTDEERPDGAKLCLNNARGVIQWNANKKEWEKK